MYRPFSQFYGGKFLLSKYIISKFPNNYEKTHYIEPFAGGLNVFFRKNKSYLESISDTNLNIYYFYKYLRDYPDKLYKKLENTMYCEETFKEAKKIY